MNSPAPSIAVDLLLSVMFLLACRWIKRNPSSFLRYILFPFGGLNVERWPRVMLVMVRCAAILGFFAFFLTIINLLYPEGYAHPTPAVLYTKFALVIVVTFFAMRGSAEASEADETPELRPLSDPKTAAPRSAPSPAKSAPVPPRSTTSQPKASPIMSKNLPAAPVAPVLPAAKPAAPPACSAQSRLSDAEAPPVPNRSNPLCEPPPGVVKERLTTVGSTIIMGAIFIGFFYLLGITWLVYAFLIFFSLAVLILFFARNAPVGACPFCGGLIQRYNRLRPEPVCCEKCGEISKFENERFSPYNPGTVSEKPIFRSALFEEAVWPNGCVQCGAPPTRFDVAQGVRYQARRLATPLVSTVYLPHPAARATGVPYCAQHRDAIQVIPPKEMFAWTPWKYLPGFEERMEARRKASLLWRSLPMMRRYLEANRRAKSGISTGYREPNLLQRTVSEVFAKPESQAPGTEFPPTNPAKPRG